MVSVVVRRVGHAVSYTLHKRHRARQRNRPRVPQPHFPSPSAVWRRSTGTTRSWHTSRPAVPRSWSPPLPAVRDRFPPQTQSLWAGRLPPRRNPYTQSIAEWFPSFRARPWRWESSRKTNPYSHPTPRVLWRPHGTSDAYHGPRAHVDAGHGYFSRLRNAPALRRTSATAPTSSPLPSLRRRDRRAGTARPRLNTTHQTHPRTQKPPPEPTRARGGGCRTAVHADSADSRREYLGRRRAEAPW